MTVILSGTRRVLWFAEDVDVVCAADAGFTQSVVLVSTLLSVGPR